MFCAEAVGFGVGVLVGVDVEVAVGTGVGVLVGVDVEVAVGTGVGVLVGKGATTGTVVEVGLRTVLANSATVSAPGVCL